MSDKLPSILRFLATGDNNFFQLDRGSRIMLEPVVNTHSPLVKQIDLISFLRKVEFKRPKSGKIETNLYHKQLAQVPKVREGRFFHSESSPLSLPESVEISSINDDTCYRCGDRWWLGFVG